MIACACKSCAHRELSSAGFVAMLAFGCCSTLLWWAFLAWLAFALLPTWCAIASVCIGFASVAMAYALAQAAGRADEAELGLRHSMQESIPANAAPGELE